MSGFRKLTVALLASAVFAVTPAAIAAQGNQDAAPQPESPIDVDAVSGDVQLIDAATLIEELQTPPLPSDLPGNYFDGATFIDPSVAPTSGPTREQLGVIPFDEEAAILNVEGSVTYIVRAVPEAFGGAASTNSLSYVIVDPVELVDPVNNEDTLDEIVDGIEESFEQDQSGGLRLVDITEVDNDAGEDDTLLAGVSGRLVTYTLEADGASAAAQLYIVPVGNVFIFSLVTVGDDGPVDYRDLSQPAEDLTVAGIEHLAEAVEKTKPGQP